MTCDVTTRVMVMVKIIQLKYPMVSVSVWFDLMSGAEKGPDEDAL